MSEANTDHGVREEPSEPRDHSARALRALLLRAAALLIGGLIVDGIAAAFHASPPTGDANDLAATFPGIAESQTWPAAHFLQFTASLIFTAGVVVLYRAAADSTRPSLLDWLGPAVTVAAAAVGSIQYAIDGVALKHAVDAWASAGPGEKDAAFRTAELARWLEWAPRATPPCYSAPRSSCSEWSSRAAVSYPRGSGCSSPRPESSTWPVASSWAAKASPQPWWPSLRRPLSCYLSRP